MISSSRRSAVVVVSVIALAVLSTGCGGRRRGGDGPGATTTDAGVRGDAAFDSGSAQICTVGETRCRDSFNVEACAPGADLVTLEWVNATTCFGGQSCMAGVCVAGGADGGTGCPGVSAVAACETQTAAMCDRIVGCCVSGAAWCDPYREVFATRSDCLSALTSFEEFSCTDRAADPAVCNSMVANCTSAYAGVNCDQIGDAVSGGTATGLGLPPGC